MFQKVKIEKFTVKVEVNFYFKFGNEKTKKAYNVITLEPHFLND
jgi:hypothetical protein